MSNNEFTKKLRAAIKAKIQELGIDVDDELPDYIMIMIANKKDKTRMKTDLMLFLGDNTDPFVDWLFDFFDKVNKKESDETKVRESEKESVNSKRDRRHSEDRVKSRSRSPIRRSRSRSPIRRSRHDDEKPKRAPIRAPSPRRERERDRAGRKHDDRRRRSRSPRSDDDRKKGRDERKRIIYESENENEHKTVRSAVVSNKTEVRSSSPKLSSQVVVKRRKQDPADSKAASSLFKRAMTSLREEDPVRRKRRSDDVLQVDTNKVSCRTVLNDMEESDEEEEPQETQFIVKLGKASGARRGVNALTVDDAPPGDENFAVVQAKRRRRADDPVRAFLKLSGVRAAKNAAEFAEFEAAAHKRLMLAPAGQSEAATKAWDGQIALDDDEEEEDSDNEAAIDAFLDAAQVSRIPTEALSRPGYAAMALKRGFKNAPVVSSKVDPSKISVRCRFWPNCRKEDSCMYFHPSKPCVNYPNCWYGDKCLFVHPSCKFEPNCSKKEESEAEPASEAPIDTAQVSRVPTETMSRPIHTAVTVKKNFKTPVVAPSKTDASKISVRCRFWPNCGKDDSCMYFHPSKPCVNFPNCWYGDKCLFVHPACKFEPNCSKPNCPYTHAVQRAVAPRSNYAPRSFNTNANAQATTVEPVAPAEGEPADKTDEPAAPAEGEPASKVDVTA